jgi:hypothetical protein
MRRAKKEKKLINLLFIPLFAILLFFIIFFPKEEKVVFIKNYTLEKKSGLLFDYEITRYYTAAKVIERKPGENYTLGIVTDPWNLVFGEIPGKGSYAKRFIDLQNLKDKKVKVELFVVGNISKKVKFSEDSFWLNPNEKKRIDVYFFTNETKSGFFEGEIRVKVEIPKYEFVYSFEKLFGGLK